MMHVPFTEGAIEGFMVKVTILTDKLDTKQVPSLVEIEPGPDGSIKCIT